MEILQLAKICINIECQLRELAFIMKFDCPATVAENCIRLHKTEKAWEVSIKWEKMKHSHQILPRNIYILLFSNLFEEIDKIHLMNII